MRGACVVGAILALVAQAACANEPTGLGGGIPAVATTGAQPSPVSALSDRRSDRASQVDLAEAMIAAKTYYLYESTFAGFDPAAASSYEPPPRSLRFVGDLDATEGAISINLATDTEVVLSTKSESGASFCMAADLDTTTYGNVDGVGARDTSVCHDPSWDEQEA